MKRIFRLENTQQTPCYIIESSLTFLIETADDVVHIVREEAPAIQNC